MFFSLPAKSKLKQIKLHLLINRSLTHQLKNNKEKGKKKETHTNGDRENSPTTQESLTTVVWWASLERTITRQRSRVLHLQEGDANTRGFHLMGRGHRRHSHIVTLKSSARINGRSSGRQSWNPARLLPQSARTGHHERVISEPVTLVHSFAKLMAKLLANRLAVCLKY